MSMIRRVFAGAAAAALLALPAFAQSYPTQAISLVVPFAPGGPTDALARLMVEPFSRELGVSVVIENLGGAGGTIGVGRVASARPDGYTLLLHNIGMATAPTLYRRLPYDPLTAFETIGLVAPVPMVWIGRPNFPGTNFADMLAFIRENGDKVNVAHAGLGSASQLCATLLQAQIRQSVTTVAFRGTGPVFAEIMGGRIDLVCDQTSSTTPYITSGRVKAFAITSAQRLSSLPDLPTATEQGTPFEVTVWHGMYAPRGTPRAIVDRVNAALRVTLGEPRLIARLAELGIAPEPQERITPEAHRAFLEAEIARWRPILTAAGEYAD
ncbi:tripartite-type tricarboxylate transporter receptor subunit TctC [Humitalea rosea]|uniref:Tripartite-type tricarboxylate transporter receptor subunit TctC n=1 Tax=Humitalea rosea TaxID=990373 RepID=A0A2W7IDY1_9PROT|nr:tripartite tricarboxylate transporter substrate-binding protein [Humitalea rosea]PZW44941.1 tripartite-type tricarboxylate transporter receptor subunit TctC [Humitalea rosea]